MHTNWESIFPNCVAENEMHLVWQYGPACELESVGRKGVLFSFLSFFFPSRTFKSCTCSNSKALLSLLGCVSMVYLAKENKRADWGMGGRKVCSAVIIIHQWLPISFPSSPKWFFCFCLISPPCASICAHMLVGPHAGLGWAGVERWGVCCRIRLMPGSSREQEKNWAICLILQWIFCLPWKKVLFS